MLGHMPFVDLQAAILAEHPELAGPADDWTVVTALRAYATAHVDYVVNVDSPYYVDLNGVPVADRFEAFEANSGGVVCGGTADAYTELLRAWGYSAWNLGIGDLSDGGFTHMQTLVQIDVDGDAVLTLHDPSTNLSFVDAAGRPLDYFDLLAALASGDDSDVAALEDHSASDNLVAAAETADIDSYATGSWTVVPDDYSVAALGDGWVVASPRTLARFEAVISPWYGPFLAGQGLPTDAVWLELSPYAIYGEGGDVLLAQAQAVIAGAAPAGATIGFEPSEGFLVGDAGGAVNQRYLDAGYAVQTWYYGAIAVVSTGDGQALQVSYVDGLDGDEEGIFELQGGTSDAVSLRVDASDGGDVRVIVKDSSYAAIHQEEVASGAVFAWADAQARIWRVVVEASGGDVIVDDFAYGDAAAAPDDGDTGTPVDSGTGADSGDGGADGDGGGPGTDDSGTPDGASDGGGEAAAVDGGCGCGAAPGSMGGWWLALAVGLVCRRRRCA